MAETNIEVTEKCNTDNRREKLFGYLDDVIVISHKKVTAERGNSDSQKQAWSRVLISAIATYGSILKDSEIDDLAKQLAELKEAVAKQGTNR